VTTLTPTRPSPNGIAAPALPESPDSAVTYTELLDVPGGIDGLETVVYEPVPAAVRPSMFERRKLELFALYEVEIQFRDRIMGGTPKDAGIIRSWLRAKAGVKPETELQEKTAQVLRELGVDVPEDATWEQIVAASDKMADNKAVGFRRDRVGGLYIETRTTKAMLKEVANILFGGEKWGATRKGPKSFVAERVFPVGDRLYLGRTEPDGTQLFVGHTTGPKGPQSNLTLYEYVTQPCVTFRVLVLRDCIPQSKWEEMLIHAEENGQGALRSQGFGRFNVLRFDRLPDKLKKSEPAESLIPAGDEPTEEEAARVKAKSPQISLDEKLAELA
jgi:hypothetical protein